MKKLFAFFLILIFTLISNLTFGQNNQEDVVYLKNGEVVRGKIVQNVPSQSLRIQTKDKKVIELKHADIEKMTRENIVEDNSTNTTKPIKFKKRGFINLTEIIDNKGTGKVEFNNKSYDNDSRSLGVRTVNGFQFDEHSSLGLGLGLEGFDDETYLSLFADYRLTFLEGRVSPVFIANVGTSIGANDSYGQLLIHPQLGMRVYLSKNVAYLLNFGYKWQQEEITIYGGVNKKVEIVFFKYVTISTGLSF